MRIVVGVPTYRRPRMLARLLDSLGRLRAPSGAEVSVIVADNNPDGSGAPVVAACAPRSALPVTCVAAPRRGISSARNRLLDAALEARADWIAFIDDDETARPDWLEHLMAAAAHHGAEVVAGPVDAILPADAPAWTASLYRTRSRRTGEPVRSVATSNVVFSIRLVSGLGLRFDERLNLAGSEDVAFFDGAAAAGVRMVWCAEAVVDEPVHPERLTRRAAFLRYLGGASSGVVAYRLRHGAAAAIARYLPKAVGKLAAALVLLPRLLLTPRTVTARFLGHAGSGIGMLAGLAGMMHRRYGQVQGS